MRVPKEIELKLHRVAALHAKACDIMHEVEDWIEVQGLAVDQFYDGSGTGLDEITHGNDVTDKFIERVGQIKDYEVVECLETGLLHVQPMGTEDFEVQPKVIANAVADGVALIPSVSLPAGFPIEFVSEGYVDTAENWTKIREYMREILLGKLEDVCFITGDTEKTGVDRVGWVGRDKAETLMNLEQILKEHPEYLLDYLVGISEDVYPEIQTVIAMVTESCPDARLRKPE